MTPGATDGSNLDTALVAEPESIAGVRQINNPVLQDERGWFTKPFQHSRFLDSGLPTVFTEQFFSHSRRGVLRGLHLQVGASEQWKLITCLAGCVWDTIVDLRVDSDTFHQHAGTELRAGTGTSLLIPPGCAHGFLVLSDEALLGYNVSAEYDSARDTGVRWDSAGIAWPLTVEPIMSDRDLALPMMVDFTVLPALLEQ